MKYSLPYVHPINWPVLRFSFRSHSSRGWKNSLRAEPSSLFSPIANDNVSFQFSEDPGSMSFLKKNKLTKFVHNYFCIFVDYNIAIRLMTNRCKICEYLSDVNTSKIKK